ncbi:hypothetical protein [Candidatus Palauibacter sp.]|uniref:hypothetical protein n=1 Tax=Candidatus Palauibacter sp. TaxID=3101350 RepID=UPI003C6F33CA
MAEVICPGLPASWINAWLAAIGATVLDPRLRLHWTRGGTPQAVLSARGADPVALLIESWPTRQLLEDMPISVAWGETPAVKRKVPVDAFAARVRAARGHRHAWTLSSTMTDLHVDSNGEVAHAPFDPAGPGTIKWLHHRLMKVHCEVEPTAERLLESLDGTAVRIRDNGLGFDLTRMGSQSDDSGKFGKWVDPAVEVLAFFGLAILPLRGTGTDASLWKTSRSSAIQRGWHRPRNRGRELWFIWPAWGSPLDRAGIDALLDIWNRGRKNWPRVGVHAAWRSVRYEPKATADTTRGFGAEPL